MVLYCCFHRGISIWKKMISIVGTRQITSYGTEFCRKLIEDLAPRSCNRVVLPMVWILWHISLRWSINCKLGVVAHGLNQIYPKPHKNMWPRWKRMAVLWPNLECLQSWQGELCTPNCSRYDRSNHRNWISRSWWLFNNGKLGQWLQPRCVCGSV
jgi:hypothetical protein